MPAVLEARRIFVGRGSTVSRARTGLRMPVHGVARWGRAWQGRCRTKSRSDTTLAHSIITKPWVPPAICPRSPLSLSPSRSLFACCRPLQRIYRRMNDTTRHDEPTREFTIDHQPGPTDLPYPPLASTLRSRCRIPSSLFAPSLFTDVTAIHPSTQFRAYWRCPSSPLLRKM